MSLLSGVEDQLRRPLRAFLFPQRVYLQLEDQAITAMALQGGSVTWLERVLLPPSLCSGGEPRRLDALADLIGDLLVERGFSGATVVATLPPEAAQVRVVRWSSGRLPADPELLLARFQRTLRLPALWHDLDLFHRDLPGEPAASLVAAVPTALLESWISVFSLAAVQLDRLESVQLSLCRALQPLLAEAPAENGLVFVLQLEAWGSALLVIGDGWPVFQRQLASSQDPGTLMADLRDCRDFLLQLWPDRPGPPLLLLHGADLVTAEETAALGAALGWPCQRLDPFERGWLRNGIPAGEDPPVAGALLALWGLAMVEQGT